MEFKLLRSFVAVAEELHFGRAAKRLNISQPPLSRQIALLEEELGVCLLYRTSRSVELTREGTVFLGEARAILAGAEAAARRVRAMAKGEAGSLRIGFVSSAMAGRLPEAISAFRERFPDILLELVEAGTSAQLEGLTPSSANAPRRLDAGFLFTSERDMPGLNVRPFLREPLILALPDSHTLANHSVVQLHDLAGEPLILFPRETLPALYDDILSCLRGVAVEPIVAQEAGGILTRVDLAAAGLGLALVPSSASRYSREGVKYRSISGGMPTLNVALAWREDDDNPALQRFLEMVFVDWN